ncbi:hypothetical protein [Desulfovibrio sp. UCD-KL4C]|uniref:hypothetical protein n=1 Tax=Desulfovibrio sp. UCD-KL4C TaxID=2578120 RepID=UPI0025BEEE66|nr:hypothetical protein [Desulfovibrio sp. UCD-KL4C]
MELLIILIVDVIYAFICYSVYAGRTAKYDQRKKAFELKKAHMTRSMDRLKSEISLLEDEIIKAEYSITEPRYKNDDEADNTAVKPLTPSDYKMSF